MSGDAHKLRAVPDGRRSAAARRARGIIVAGMHRSGTSAITRVLGLLGADLPRDDYDPREDNPLGFWESSAIVGAHDEFLRAIGSSWDDVLPIAPASLQSDRAMALRSHLRLLLEEQFGESLLFAIKDPRLCRLLPVWLDVLDDFGAEPAFVLPIRSPLEVAASLKDRDGFSGTKSYLLWLRSVLEAERATRGSARSFVSYEALLRDWPSLVDTMARDLATSFPRSQFDAYAQIDAFLSSQHRHHAFDLSELRARSDVSEWVTQAYDAVLAATAGRPADSDVLDGISAELARADLTYGVIVAENRLALAASEGANEQWESELRLAEEVLARSQEALARSDEALRKRSDDLASLRAELERVVAERRELLAARTEAARLAERVAEREAQLRSMEEALGGSEQALRERSAELEGSERQANRLGEELGSLRAELEHVAEERRELLASRDEANRLAARVAEQETQLVLVEEALADAEQALRERSTELERVLAAERKTRADYDELEQQAVRLIEQLGEFERLQRERGAELESLRAQLQRMVAERQELLESRDEAHRLAGRLAEQETQLHAVEVALAESDQVLRESRDETAWLVAHVAGVESRLRDAEQARGDAERARAQGSNELHSVAAQLEDARRLLTEHEAALHRAQDSVRQKDAELAEHARLVVALRAAARPRSRAISQFLSWLVRPTPRRLGYIRAYLALRREGAFDPVQYLLAYPDVLDAGLDPLMHYVEHGRWEGREAAPRLPPADPAPEPPSGTTNVDEQVLASSGLFDDAFYRSAYPGVVGEGESALDHFCTLGWRDGKKPNEYFETAWYLQTYPDVAAAGINPLLDYVTGREDRWPAPFFDPDHYRRAYGFAGTSAEALADYLDHVRRGEWRNPLDLFDTAFYLDAHADVRQAEIDPALHYIWRGYLEGRNPSPSFATEHYRAMNLADRPDLNPLVDYYSRRANAYQSGVATGAGDRSLAEEIRYWTSPGDDFEELDPTIATGAPRVKALAFYLPQFHPIPENDEWWGKGFTEWRNVTRGTPRFAGHYQPRTPRDLGFYDLLDTRVMQRQVELARAGGIHGFCFYYYWFDGRRLLERPLESWLTDAALELPFCLMWANENWTRRWDGLDDEILIGQTYAPEDDQALVDDLQRFFADPRYIRIDGRPLLFLYRVDIIREARQTLERWRELWAARHGEEPLIFMAQTFGIRDPRPYGFDGAVEFPPHKFTEGPPVHPSDLRLFDRQFSGRVYDYDALVADALAEPPPGYPLIKTLVPSWDNDARRQGAGLALRGSTPASYERWLRGLVEWAERQPLGGEKFVCINAWNEWAEAAYLEPDVHYGSAYLNATARTVFAPSAVPSKRKVLFVGHDGHPFGAQLNVWHMGRVLKEQFGCEVAYLLKAGGPMVDRYAQLGPVCVADESDERAAAFVRELRAAGFGRAITNTAGAGALVRLLTQGGFHVVSLIHELPGIVEEYGLDGALREIFALSDRVVMPAPVVAERLRGFGELDEARLAIRPQGLYRSVADDEQAGARVRLDLGVPQDAGVILSVGSGDARKGFDQFLDTASRMWEERPNYHFVWVGRLHADAARLLEELADGHRHGNLHVVDYTEEVAPFYHAADVFFLTSREDPFPTVILEALELGLPVVGYRGVGGMDGLIEELGRLVDADDHEAVAAALTAAVEETDTHLIEARRRTVAERFRFDDYCFDLLRFGEPELARVSVVVPNFNYAQYLPERLAAIFGQTHPVFELIVLDDCSTDDSIVVLDELRREGERDFRLVASDRNSGSAFRQWAAACRIARGDYLWIAEADDLAEPGFLERVVAKLASTGAAFAFSDSAPVDEVGRKLGESYKEYCRQAAGDLMDGDFVLDGEEFARRCLLERNLVLNVSAVVWDRRRLLDALDAHLDDVVDFRVAGDWYVYAAAALAPGARVAYLADPLSIHRRHASSVTHMLDAARHVEEVHRMHATLAEWLRLTPAERARMHDYSVSLQRQFGVAPPTSPL